MTRHVLSIFDLTADEIRRVFQVSRVLKQELAAGRRRPLLAGRAMGLLFDKPSLRTRVSFETAMIQLGGGAQFFGREVGWGTREPVSDFGRVLSQYLDVLVCRAYRHEQVEQLAGYCQCPVINGLTDAAHPCQALADVLTIIETFGDIAGRRVAFVGDGNNVARSLAGACAKLGAAFVLAAPAAYQFPESFLERLRREAPEAQLEQTTDPAAAVREADVVYTDVWASMGQEAEMEERVRAFASYQVNAQLLQQAPRRAIVLHCLPARRGQEITDEVLDGPQSRVLQQAANRLHVQKGLLVWLLLPEESLP